MAKTVTLRSSDGVEFQADLKAMTSFSRVVSDFVEAMGSDRVIPVPNVPGIPLKLLIRYCEGLYETLGANCFGTCYVDDILGYTPSWRSIFPFPTAGIGQETTVCETIRNTLLSRYTGLSTFNGENIVEAKRCLEEEVHDTNFVNKHCSMLNLNTIIGLHEGAKFLNIPSLLFLTTTLINEAPSRKFLELVSPWQNYDDLERYRKREMEVC